MYMLGHIHLSVRLSVRHTSVLCQNEGTRGMRFSLSGSLVSLFFWRQEWFMWDDPVQVKFECKEVDPCKSNPAVRISPYNSGTVTDSEESSINANRKSTMGFPTSHRPRSCATPNFPKCLDTQVSHFLHRFRQKSIKSLLQSFIL